MLGLDREGTYRHPDGSGDYKFVKILKVLEDGYQNGGTYRRYYEQGHLGSYLILDNARAHSQKLIDAKTHIIKHDQLHFMSR